MPCWEVFDPKKIGGRPLIFLGFSVRAEHAHQNQRRLPLNKCWVKEHLPITNTAGATFVSKLKYLQGLILSGELEKISIFALNRYRQ